MAKRICAPANGCALNYGYATPAGSFPGTPPASFTGLKEILQKHRPRAVIVALGTNDASQGCHKNSRQAQAPIAGLLKLVAGRRCAWIGPPSYTRGPVFNECGEDYETFVNQLKETVLNHHCRFIDSRQIIDPATQRPVSANYPDQIHFDPELGAFWARQVISEIGDL